MSLLFMRHSTTADARAPEAALQVLLDRMRQRLYPETLPVLASCWLKTLWSAGHNRVWWERLRDRMDRALLDLPLDPFAHAVLMSARNWAEATVLGPGGPPQATSQLQPPFRPLAPERLVSYIGRLLNESLPAEVAYLLTREEEWTGEPEDGIPVLARAKALERLLLRDRFSPETLQMLLAIGTPSPKCVYPADLEILRDVLMAILGRMTAAPLAVLPAELLGIASEAVLPFDYEDRVRHASLLRAEDGSEELHVQIADADALAILEHDAVRIGSVVVTIDGRGWRPHTLDRSDGNRIVYRPGERLRIDCTSEHARLTVEWPEIPHSWSGELPHLGPFELFGREWRSESWEVDGDRTLLHLTFSRVLSITEPHFVATEREHLHSANVEMAWSELERALAESVLERSGDAVERMRRSELIPLGRALYALAGSLDSGWGLKSKEIETHLRAARYHHAAVASEYGQAPWRILPDSVRTSLARKTLKPEMFEMLSGIFADVRPPHAAPSPSPSQAA